MADLPLAGIRIVDLTRAQQGPFATVMLSDLGADVIKVEEPGVGDHGRGVVGRRLTHGVNTYFLAHNRNKKSITADIRKPAGQEIVRRLCRSADVFVHNFRPGTLERVGLGYEDICQIQPAIIYACASGFGLKGPYAERPKSKPGNDIIGQAMGGLMSMTGDERTGPIPAGAAIADQVGAMNLAYGIMVALFVRERTGQGQMVDSSLLGSQLALQCWEITDNLVNGPIGRKAGGGHPLVPALWNTFATSDGHLVIGGVAPKRWSGFCRALGLEAIEHDERFATPQARIDNQPELLRIVGEVFRTKTRAEWLERLAEVDAIAGPVYSYEEMANDPQVWANEYLVELDHPGADLEKVRTVGVPVKLSKTPGRVQRHAPELGEHTHEVLVELGYAWEEIGQLHADNVI